MAPAPAELLQGLLRQPALLRDLQWLVFAHGGEYWTNLIDQAAAQLPAAYREMIDRVREQIDRGPGPS